MKSKRFNFFGCFFIIGFFIILANTLLVYSTFIVQDNVTLNEGGTSGVQENEPVCYVDRTNTYYTTVEKALEDSYQNGFNDTIYVIPGTNPVIKRNCTIDYGDKLFIYMLDDSGNIVENSGVANANGQSGGTLQCVNSLTIDSNITLTNNGTIETSGRLSAAVGGNSWGGNTFGNYTEIILKSNSKIICGTESFLYLYGFIREADSINNGSSIEVLGTTDGLKGGQVFLPFVFKFRGGNFTVPMIVNKDSKCFIFNMYKLINDSVKTIIHYGANVNVYVNMYMSNSYYPTTINLVGSNAQDNVSLFQLSTSNSYAEIKYDMEINNKLCTPKEESTNSNETLNANKIKLDFYGGMDISEMSLTISGYTVKVSEYFFPLNYYFDISLNGYSNTSLSVYNFPYYIKLLPGSRLTISENAILNANEIAIYSTFSEVSGLGSKYPSGLEEAYFCVNGELNVNKIGGKIITNSNSSKLYINVSSNLSTKECTSAGTLILAEYVDYNHIATGLVGGTENIYKSNLQSNLDYFGKGQYWARHGILVLFTDLTSTIISQTIYSPGDIISSEKFDSVLSMNQYSVEDHSTYYSIYENKINGWTLYGDTTLVSSYQIPSNSEDGIVLIFVPSGEKNFVGNYVSYDLSGLKNGSTDITPAFTINGINYIELNSTFTLTIKSSFFVVNTINVIWANGDISTYTGNRLGNNNQNIVATMNFSISG